MDFDTHMRELGAKGYLFMGIRAEDTLQNAAIHNAFREMAKVECKNDYTLALGKLIEYYSEDAKFQQLWGEIQRLDAEVSELRNLLKEKPTEDAHAF